MVPLYLHSKECLTSNEESIRRGPFLRELFDCMKLSIVPCKELTRDVHPYDRRHCVSGILEAQCPLLAHIHAKDSLKSVADAEVDVKCVYDPKTKRRDGLRQQDFQCGS